MRPSTAERAVLYDTSNPLDHVIPTLERLDASSDGEHHFCVRAHDSAGSDFITLMRSGDETALSLYARLTEAHELDLGRHTRIRNQTLVKTPDNDVVLVTGDVLRCAQGGNHPLGVSSRAMSELEVNSQLDEQDRIDFDEILSHMLLLMNKIQPGNEIDEAAVQHRLGDVCRYGELCTDLAVGNAYIEY